VTRKSDCLYDTLGDIPICLGHRRHTENGPIKKRESLASHEYLYGMSKASKRKILSTGSAIRSDSPSALTFGMQRRTNLRSNKGDGLHTEAAAPLWPGEKAIENGNPEEQIPFRFTANSNFDFVCDTITPVSDASESPFVFTGKIERVLLDISDIEFNELVGTGSWTSPRYYSPTRIPKLCSLDDQYRSRGARNGHHSAPTGDDEAEDAV